MNPKVIEEAEAHRQWYNLKVTEAIAVAKQLPEGVQEYVTKIITDIYLEVPWNLIEARVYGPLRTAGWQPQPGGGRHTWFIKHGCFIGIAVSETRAKEE